MKCNICPRKCNINRRNSTGFCGAGAEIKIARAALHFWEEPCISGTRGSGTIFFCGCNLRCVYCQNTEISHGHIGKEISTARLASIFSELQSLGAHNINLVTPTHYANKISEALNLAENDLKIPVIYNCGGYESVDSLDMLSKNISVFLTDMKYSNNTLAEKYSSVPNYCEVSEAALFKMLDIAGPPVFNEDGLIQSGVIVRHLVLPSYRHDSIAVLKRLKALFGTDSFILSIMSQFTPNGTLDAFPEINRRITSFEYKTVTDAALDLGFTNAYVQSRTSAEKEYTPPFDLTGV